MPSEHLFGFVSRERGDKVKIEEILIREGKYVGATAGVSMLPMLKSGRDLVVILPAKSRLKPLDVALYKRDGKYLLHRVIAIANGCYVLRGDNCYAEERVEEGQILGVLAGFFPQRRLLRVFGRALDALCAATRQKLSPAPFSVSRQEESKTLFSLRKRKTIKKN